MKPGRKPKPSNLKIMAGNPGHRAINQNEPIPDPGIPECPPDLTDAAKDEWAYIAPELEKMGVLTRADRAALVCYCESYAQLQEARILLYKNNGAIVVTDTGFVMQHPAVGMMNSAKNQIRAFAEQFGLTPSARTRISIEKPRETSAIDRFITPKKSG